MALITSISGIRGTIGGKSGQNLTPIDIVKFTSAYAFWLKINNNKSKPKVILGRDARLSGQMVANLVKGTLISLGIDIVDINLATTPTTEIAVIQDQADGGIIITASHNPMEWNALKFLNAQGEFLDPNSVQKIIEIYENIDQVSYSPVEELGTVKQQTNYAQRHIDLILELDLVDVEAIKKAQFKVVVDCINSVGSIIIPDLLWALGVRKVVLINCEPTGKFEHKPEPLEQNLTELMNTVVYQNADVGFAVDPDVDRLAIVSEDGTYFGEEYSLVAAADYVLSYTPGNTVSNLSSTRALKDLTEKYGGKYYAAPVGEINVVLKMKQVNAVIGGEGNGGVIYPKLHYGRDALVGIALFLSFMARKKLKPSQIKARLPQYYMEKAKVRIEDIDFDKVKQRIVNDFSNRAQINTMDGIKLDFPDKWIHIRKSNTEPVVRIYAEAKTAEEVKDFIAYFINTYFS